MADYEIVAVGQIADDVRNHHIQAVQVGKSLFLVDQIIDWISDGTHRFFVHVGDEEVDVVVRQRGDASGRPYLTTEGEGFPPVALLSLPRVYR